MTTIGLTRMTVRADATIRDAMSAIDAGAASIALVVGADDRLLGVVTDGDLRRALLRGVEIDEPLLPAINRAALIVTQDADRTEILDLMQARAISQVPVIDADGRPVAVHLLREIVGATEILNWAVVMAGGRGTRLGDLTTTVPKPMLLVAGRPILERIVLHLVGNGFRELYLSVNYLGHVIEEHFGDGSRFGCHITYLREHEPLGTAGALSLMPQAPTSPMLVMNGDLITQARVDAMVQWHGSGPQKATIGIRRYTHEVPFGCIELDGDRVVSTVEKPRLVEVVNSGMYVLDPDVVRQIPRDTHIDMPDVIDTLLVDGFLVRGYEIEGDWVDIGQRHQLDVARRGSP